MKPLKIVLAGLLLTAFFGTGETFGAEASHTTRTDSGGGVTVKVTYLDSKTSNEVLFQVVLDTHSVNLDSYDLKTLTVLRDDTGKTYLPKEVENKGSGHHREATLIFPKLSSEAKRLEIAIKDVGGMKERTFNWDVQ
ncbi:MAG TPA: hypothetical protein VGA01_07035 [Candidatus Binatia bacterium]